MMNKKGIGLIGAVLIIAGIVVVLLISGGLLSALKLNAIIKSIPALVWYIIIGLLVLIILRKSKK